MAGMDARQLRAHLIRASQPATAVRAARPICHLPRSVSRVASPLPLHARRITPWAAPRSSLTPPPRAAQRAVAGPLSAGHWWSLAGPIRPATG